MDFLSEYPRLEPAQMERFREVVTRLQIPPEGPVERGAERSVPSSEADS